MDDNISSQGGHAFPAEGKYLLIKGSHTPQEKASHRGQGLSRPHRTVADDGIEIPELRAIPPGQGNELALTEANTNIAFGDYFYDIKLKNSEVADTLVAGELKILPVATLRV